MKAKEVGKKRCFEIKSEWRYWGLDSKYRNLLSRVREENLKQEQICKGEKDFHIVIKLLLEKGY